jgi:putative intracellular protease/amidase
MKKILIIVTNHATLGSTDDKNGTYLPELTHAIHEFREANIEYAIASIKGGVAPIYGEDTEGDIINSNIYSEESFKESLNNTHKVMELDFNEYDAIYYPGGYGLLTDITTHEELGKKSAEFYESNKPIGAVCHGPAALIPITLSNGESILEHKNVTAFTREEEIDMNTLDSIPFLLEEKLARTSKSYTKLKPWSEHVIVDGKLVTGQNPQSASKVGKELINLI